MAKKIKFENDKVESCTHEANEFIAGWRKKMVLDGESLLKV